MKMRSAVFAAHLVVAGMQSAVAHACGYENPQTVALGSLNWIYPDALHVRAAVWRAEDAGLLPPGGKTDSSGPLAFYRAAGAVKKLGSKLAHAYPADTGLAISIVLVPQVMWTRFEFSPGGLTVQSHVEGPREGDPVIVSEDKVIRELVDGKLDPVTAEESGLLRFYGSPEEIATVRAALTRMFGAQ